VNKTRWPAAVGQIWTSLWLPMIYYMLRS